MPWSYRQPLGRPNRRPGAGASAPQLGYEPQWLRRALGVCLLPLSLQAVLHMTPTLISTCRRKLGGAQRLVVAVDAGRGRQDRCALVSLKITSHSKLQSRSCTFRTDEFSSLR